MLGGHPNVLSREPEHVVSSKNKMTMYEEENIF